MSVSRDNVPEELEEQWQADIIKYKEKYANLSGIDRVMLTFKPDQYGNTSPEMEQVATSAALTFFAGGIFYGIASGSKEFNDFISNNKATTFNSMAEARSKLSNQLTLKFMQVFLTKGLKLAAFTGAYFMTVNTISAYRNSTDIREFVLAGGICGGAVRYKFGLRGILSGAIIGKSPVIYQHGFKVKFQ